jgi:phosphatidylserine/phosphatidylglycerophosphate/cardiolipin synthase-like enzyme
MQHWFLTREERGNPDTRLDDHRPDGQAWTHGNLVEPLIHGAAYFGRLKRAVDDLTEGDLLLFADWRGDPDERMTDAPDSEIGQVLCGAAARGVIVRGLIWRSHLDRFKFSSAENRHLGEEIQQAGGVCLLDMRVRLGGSHHQKFLVLRHRTRPDQDVAFVGGIDLCHSRRDDATHAGDPQGQPMAKVYGDAPPWHDVQLAIRGPAVADVETVFRERWDDQQLLSRDPIRLVTDRLRGTDSPNRALPAPLPPSPAAGPHAVQLLRTYPQRLGGYPFARHGERSVARAYLKVLERAEHLIYLEDQYLWSREITRSFAEALERRPTLRFIAVLPHFPDQDGRVSMPPNDAGRLEALDTLRSVAPDRFAAYGVENHAGTPVYVHAKVCVIDDTWASVGSDNVNRRSWTHDSELSAAILDETPTDRQGFARGLRLELAREHLDRVEGADRDLVEPAAAFDAFASSARALQCWYDSGQIGPRPPGRLRPLRTPSVSAATRIWASVLYRTLYDPDGRGWRVRRRHGF